jgi:hypothetical protein
MDDPGRPLKKKTAKTQRSPNGKEMLDSDRISIIHLASWRFIFSVRMSFFNNLVVSKSENRPSSAKGREI